MGNQLPVKCVACNPSCCANCINLPLGRDEVDSETRGNAFANASAVLSEGGQEFAAHFNLEKELANEVELWRSSSVLPSEAARTCESSPPRGRPDFRDGLAGAMTRKLHGEVPFDFERSLSPPARSQVSLQHRPSLTPRDAATPPFSKFSPDPQKADVSEPVEELPSSRGNPERPSGSQFAAPYSDARELPEDTIPAGVPSETQGYDQEKAVSTATATSDGDVQWQERPLAIDRQALSDVSSEDSTFVGFIEDTTGAEGFVAGAEYRIHFADPKDGGRLAASNQQARLGGDQGVPDTLSFVSEASGLKPDRMQF